MTAPAPDPRSKTPRTKKGKPKKVIAVALAARMARALWAMASRREKYKAKVLSISNPKKQTIGTEFPIDDVKQQMI